MIFQRLSLALVSSASPCVFSFSDKTLSIGSSLLNFLVKYLWQLWWWGAKRLKRAFFQKVRFVFQISKSQKKKYSKKNYPELEYYVMGGNFKFQTQDSFWNILFWRFEEQITLSEKKTPFIQAITWRRCKVGFLNRWFRYFPFFFFFLLKATLLYHFSRS